MGYVSQGMILSSEHDGPTPSLSSRSKCSQWRLDWLDEVTKMPLFDTHTHLNAQQFAGQEADYIARALAADVGYLAVVGFDDPTIERSLALSAAYDNIIR